MGDATDGTQNPNSKVEADDLDLVDDALEDEGKDEAELWSEFDRAEAAAEGGESPDDESGDDAGEAAAEDDDNDDDGSAPAGEAPQGDQPANDQSGGDEPPDSGQAQGNDLWASATPEQRAAWDAAQTQLKKLEQAERSNRGRLSAMQRQVNELLSGRQQSPPAANQAANGDDKGQGQGGKQDAEGILASAAFKRLSDDYPEVAGPLGELIGDMQTQLTRAQKELSAIGDERRQDALSEQEELLIEDHPDWVEVTVKPEFGSWLHSQPRHIREAAFRNGNGIVDAEEAADVVGRFKSYLKEQSQQQDGGGQEPAGDGARPDNSDRGNGQSQLSGKRQRQLESASGARSRSRPGVSSSGLPPEDGDPAQIWKAFDELEARQARRA